jgi:hypothetical protein
LRVNVDIGLSWNAPFSRHWLTCFPQDFVIGVEPNPRNIRTLFAQDKPPVGADLAGTNRLILSKSEVLRASKLIIEFERFMLVQMACANTSPHSRQFYAVHDDPGTSSLNQPKFTNDYTLDTIMLDSLSNLLDKVPLKVGCEFGFLKVDTQGYDYEVLKSAGEYLGLFTAVQFELPSFQYEGEIGFTAHCCALLKKHGFVPIRASSEDMLFSKPTVSQGELIRAFPHVFGYKRLSEVYT